MHFEALSIRQFADTKFWGLSQWGEVSLMSLYGCFTRKGVSMLIVLSVHAIVCIRQEKRYYAQ